MGRWAQAQRRGGFVTAGNGCPLNINGDAVRLTSENIAGPFTRWSIAEYLECVPTGAVGINVAFGTTDCGDDSTIVALAGLPTAFHDVPGDDQSIWTKYFWVDSLGNPIGAESPCTEHVP